MMTRAWWGRFFVLLFFVILSGIYVFPTVFNLDLEKTKFPFKQKMNLGLDLQGGLYLVLGVDFHKVYRDLIDRQMIGLRDRLQEKEMTVTRLKVMREGFPAEDPRIILELHSEQRDSIYQLIKKEFKTLRLSGESTGQLELGLTREYRQEVREKTVNQSIEVIRNRIDAFGVTEPVISSQGTDRVVVELPGVREIDRAKELIGRTAKLEFKIVNATVTASQLAEWIEQFEKQNPIQIHLHFSEYVLKLNEFVKNKIPEDTEIAFQRIKSVSKSEETGESAGDGMHIPYLLHSKTEVTGSDLQDASVQIDPDNRRPLVSFSLNPRGATLFEKLTEENKGRALAIVLDNIVHSAPVIQNRIPGGKGQITLGSRGDPDIQMKEAKDLAIVLRAGALPAQLDFLEQRVVGPSLGQDSIHKSAIASLIGCCAVFIFMVIYYRLSGIIAVFSLLLNVLFVLALQVGFEVTLTLPGIAAIALTVGIAVDSNVVIYERIREELRLGKRPGMAVEAGFQKAFRTILDANVTNAAAAIVLFLYGTGPIKGFAVTLLIGIITTLVTAVFVCRLVFDLYLKYLDNRKSQIMSI